MYYGFFCGLLITYCTTALYKPPQTPYMHTHTYFQYLLRKTNSLLPSQSQAKCGTVNSKIQLFLSIKRSS